MKKALSWLTENHIEFVFHDYRKDGITTENIERWITHFGWEQVINKRGTTWRSLDEKTKVNMNDQQAIVCALENPAIIKRPLLIKEDKHIIGFSIKSYEAFFV